MNGKKRATRKPWVDPDDAPELTEDFFEAADEYEGGQQVAPQPPPLDRTHAGGERALRRRRAALGHTPKRHRQVRHLRVRYYNDPETGCPHMYKHRVFEDEVEYVLAHPWEDRPGTEGSRVAVGPTDAGRFLRVVYVPDPSPNSVFVITAYDLKDKPLAALRRRRRRKRS
jgi:hypothetical protein